MKLYWPMAICEDGYKMHTYEGFKNAEECKKVFEEWEKGYKWWIKEAWIDVTDSKNSWYRARIDVKKDYILGEEVEIDENP